MRDTLPPVWEDVDSVLIDETEIERRVRELAEQISHDLEGLGDEGEIVLVPILTGSIIFVADLMRQLPQKLRINVATVSSYPGKSMESQGSQLASDIPPDLEDKHVLIVDDILDSGGTIRLIRALLEQRRARSVRACVLLRKHRASALATPCEYIGFDIPDEFVVGYGLDYDNYYRNLPAIGTLKKEAL
ncbi:MAG: hypoxanthine phosphoribosyltransferase [Planctomycetota bacterium]